MDCGGGREEGEAEEEALLFCQYGSWNENMEEGMDAYVEGWQGEFAVDVCWGAPVIG